MKSEKPPGMSWKNSLFWPFAIWKIIPNFVNSQPLVSSFKSFLNQKTFFFHITVWILETKYHYYYIVK